MHDSFCRLTHRGSFEVDQRAPDDKNVHDLLLPASERKGLHTYIR